jgi:hypothetical protein
MLSLTGPASDFGCNLFVKIKFIYIYLYRKRKRFVFLAIGQGYCLSCNNKQVHMIKYYFNASLVCCFPKSLRLLLYLPVDGRTTGSALNKLPVYCNTPYSVAMVSFEILAIGVIKTGVTRLMIGCQRLYL